MKEVNKENEFERLLKEKADRFEMKPAPEVWQQVQDVIQNDRRRRFPWWLMAALLFAVMGTGAYFMFEKKSSPPAAPVTVENNSDQNSKGVNNSPAETTNTEKNPISGSNNDNTSVAQDQSTDNTLPKNQQEKISVEKKNKESNSVALNNAIESPEAVQMQIPPMAGQPANSDDSEFMASLSTKLLPLSLPEASIHELTIKKSSFDFSSLLSSNHSFYFEADAMALKSFVWSRTTSSPDVLNSANPSLQVNTSSYSFTKGFSAGGNFIFEQNSKWLLGIGLHLTKTHHEAITSQQTIPLYDTSYLYGIQIYIGDTIAYQSRSDINQWFDVSLFTGVKLFPSSKNHIRILAGGGYSRLLANVNSHSITPAAYDIAFDSIAGIFSPSNDPTQLFAYRENQLQLFSEVAYQRDLTAQLSFTAGMQLHYYPMNLLNGEGFSQRMMWVGLKGGLLFRF